MSGARPSGPVAARNRKARYQYLIEETLEAGIVLAGSEVKSLREGRANITEAYAAEKSGELYLMNAYVAEYPAANRFNHKTRRPRKLLLHRRQLDKLVGAVRRQGMTLVPLSIYFNDEGRVKVELALARGKRKYDKRAAEKEREWRREKERLLRNRG